MKKIKLDKRPNIDIITADNTKVKAKEVFYPTGFVPEKPKKTQKKEIGKNYIKDGRVYEVVQERIGMFCDNGELFLLK